MRNISSLLAIVKSAVAIEESTDNTWTRNMAQRILEEAAAVLIAEKYPSRQENGTVFLEIDDLEISLSKEGLEDLMNDREPFKTEGKQKETSDVMHEPDQENKQYQTQAEEKVPLPIK